MIPTLELIDDPPGLEIREGPNRHGGIGALVIAAADLGRLADYLDDRLRLPGRGRAEERLAAAVQAMTARAEIKPEYARNRDHIATYCEHAAVPYEERWRLDDNSRWVQRWTPLFQSTEPNGFLRTAGLRTRPPDPEARYGDWSVTFSEDVTNPAQPYPDDVHSRYSYEVRIIDDDLDRFIGGVSARLGLDGRGEGGSGGRNEGDGHGVDISRIFVDLAARGELSAAYEPGANRDRVVAWCRETGTRFVAEGRAREHTLLRAPHRGRDTRLLVLTFLRERREVRLREEHRVGDHYEHENSYVVTIGDDVKADVVAWLEQRQGLAPAPGRIDDRLIAAFQSLVDMGELSDERPRAGNRERVASLLSGAGIAFEQSGFARREPLLSVHRTATDCVYELSLKLDRAERLGIAFRESYDYLPRPGDAGREYAYGVRAPYAQLETLVAHLEQGGREPATGDLEDRLIRCFRDRIARGELTGDLPLRAARDRVAGWFAEAGVAAEPSDWHWFSGD